MRTRIPLLLVPLLAACLAAPPAPRPGPFAPGAYAAATWRDLDPAFAAGATVRRTMLQVIQHNLANVDTPGFKRSRVEVSTLPYATAHEAAAERETAGGAPTFGLQVGTGPYVRAITIVHTPGVLELSKRLLDVAIDGEGFLVVRRPDGSRGYTRDGRLQLDAQGRLVDGCGDVVLPETVVPAGTLDISIDREGRVAGRLAGGEVAQELGRLQLAQFANPEGLRALRDNVFAETPASGTPQIGMPGQGGLGTVHQGFLERSNVEVPRELMLWHALSSVVPGEPAPVPPLR